MTTTLKNPTPSSREMKKPLPTMSGTDQSGTSESGQLLKDSPSALTNLRELQASAGLSLSQCVDRQGMRYDSSHGTLCGQSEDQSRVVIRPIIGGPEWDWFKSHNPITLTEDTRGLVALYDGKPAAACAMSHFHGYSVEVHQIIVRPIVLRYGWLETSMRAAFGDHVLVVYSYVRQVNAKALAFNKHMGMEVVGRIPNAGGPGDDYIVMIGRRENCKQLKE